MHQNHVNLFLNSFLDIKQIIIADLSYLVSKIVLGSSNTY